jgi:protein kinase-like protein
LGTPGRSTWGEGSDVEGGRVEGGDILAGSRLRGLTAFGPYEVQRVLAKGGMGAVFEVRHRQVGASYALKTVLAAPNTPGFALQHARFRREAELNARLDHPGILRVHSAELDQDPPYLVVDLLRGGSLGDRLDEGGPIPLAEGPPLALALARALRHAHQAGVLHRDLKPENVMFDEFGEARLVDFGLALEVGRESRLTQSGTAVGTPLTMAPEQIRGEREETAATDVYGLAATIYWALSGDAPLGSEFQGLPDLIGAILSRPVRPLREVLPEVPRELSDLLQASLAKEPESRPTLDRWVEVLELLQHLSASGSALERFVARTTTKQRLGFLAFTTCALLGAVAWATLGLLPPTPQANATPTPGPSVAATPAERDWRSAHRAGAVSEARRKLLLARAPLSSADAALAAAALTGGGPDEELGPALAGFQERLRGLPGETRASLWSLACLVANDPKRARRVARRETSARELVDVEVERAQVEAAEVIPRLTELRLKASLQSAREAFASLSAAGKRWSPRRLSRLSPLDRALADLVLDRLTWTLSRLGFVLIQSARVHGSGSTAVITAIQLLQAHPQARGLGWTTLRLFIASDQTSGNYPEHYEIYARARAYEVELLADPGGRALLGTLAVRYERRPEEAIRLGVIAYEQTQPMADLSRHAHWIVPRLVRRRVELEWLGRDLPAPQQGMESAQSFLKRELAGKHADLFPALLAWHLSRREFEEVRLVLKEAAVRDESDPDWRNAILLARSELDLAEDPAGSAGKVLKRHEPPQGLWLEEFGIRAHAKALAGLDNAKDLAELERLGDLSWRRIGFPWHAFDVPGLLEGKVWWPGVPR